MKTLLVLMLILLIAQGVMLVRQSYRIEELEAASLMHSKALTIVAERLDKLGRQAIYLPQDYEPESLNGWVERQRSRLFMEAD